MRRGGAVMVKAGRIGEEEEREGVCPWGELLGRTGKSVMLFVS